MPKAAKPNIKQLLPDIGIGEEESHAFRNDALAYLEQQAGNLNNMLGLRLADLKAHAKDFVDSKDGRKYFKRVGEKDEWRHITTRPNVETILPEILNQYLKNKRSAMAKTDSSASLKPGKVSPKQSAKSPKISSYYARREPANEKKSRSPSMEIEDDGKSLPDIQFQARSSDTSLLDVSELVANRSEPQTVPQMRSLWSPSSTQPAATRPADASPGVSPATREDLISKDAGPKTPARPAHGSLPSPPITSPKRRFLQISGHDNPDDQYGALDEVVTKRARPAIIEEDDDMDMTTDDESPPTPGPAKRQVSPAPTIPAVLPTPTSASAPILHPSIEGIDSNAEPTVSVPLSHTAAWAAHIDITIDSLRDAPATILDYVRKCERTCLSRAKDQSLDLTQRRRHQEKSKLFRDLYADLESRLVSMSQPQSKVEAGEESSQNSQFEISSYSLWD